MQFVGMAKQLFFDFSDAITIRRQRSFRSIRYFSQSVTTRNRGTGSKAIGKEGWRERILSE